MRDASADARPDVRAARRAVLAVGLIALVAFVPALHGGFVYDDHRFVEGNPALRHLSILWRAFTDPSCQTSDDSYAGLWRPLRTLSFALDRLLFGASPVGPHAVNVALHAAGAALVTAMLLAWRLPALAAALGGTLYALHPAQVECVAWISSRGDLLAAAFVLAAIVADLRGRRPIALAFGAAALLSKEQAVVWPILVFISRAVACGRADVRHAVGARPVAGTDAAAPILAALRTAVGPAVAVVVFLVVRASVLPEPLQEGGLGRGTPGIPVLGSMLAHQVWTVLVPGAPVFDWQMPWTSHPPAAVALVALGVVAAFVWRRSRAPAAWFLAGIAPTWAAQAFVPLNILVADRFLLFSLPAVALLAARGVATGGRACAAACATVALCFAVQTETAIPTWRSDAALWGRTAGIVPGHWRANVWLGDDALRSGRLDEAERILLAAAEAAPGDGKTRWLLATTQELAGKKAGDAVQVGAALLNCRAAIQAFRAPRAEGAPELLPLARWMEADLLLLLGRRDEARAAIDALLAEPPPVLGDEASAALAQRVRQLAERAAAFLGEDVAARVRAWGPVR